MTTPYFKSSKNGIGIRPYESSDLTTGYASITEAIAESVEQASVNLDLLWCHSDYNLMEDTKNWINARIYSWPRGSHFCFVIYSTSDGKYLGEMDVVITDDPNNCGNIGYWVRKSAVNQGIATIASELAVKFAFRELKLIRIEIFARLNNIASHRVAEKIGATKEGIARNRILLRDKPYDAIMYSLIPEDLGMQFVP